jgi:hypothetical protein
MAIHAKYKIPKFWDNEYKTLEYIEEEFNDPESMSLWKQQGYTSKFTGAMCDMRSTQPSWNDKFLSIYEALGWKNIGTSYYRMGADTVLPTHSDLYVKYVKLYNLQGQEHRIRRAIVFLEDWKAGHYSEINGTGFVNWSAGDVLEWEYDTPHAAANIGIEDRYTLQITGWI